MEKKKYTYNLTFEEVLEEIWYKDCWYQGNNFADGSVLEVTPDKEIYPLYVPFLILLVYLAPLSFLLREFMNKCIVVYILNLMLKGEFDVISSLS